MNKKSDKRQDPAKELQMDKEEIEALSARVAERRLEEQDWQRLHRYLVLLLKLTNVLEAGRVRMRKLTRILFGKRTEKDPAREDKKSKDKNTAPPGSPAAGGQRDTPESEADAGQSEPDRPDSEPEKESPAKGHPSGQRLPECARDYLSGLPEQGGRSMSGVRKRQAAPAG